MSNVTLYLCTVKINIHATNTQGGTMDGNNNF